MVGRGLITAAMLLSCNGADRVVAGATFTISEVTGNGTSPLEGITGQQVSFTIEFDPAAASYQTVDTCKWTVLSANEPARAATGATAETVTTYMLDLLPAWDLRLSLCDTATLSSVILMSDNHMGMGVSFGCLALPPSAIVRDGDGNPTWTEFTATRCDAMIYDEAHARLFLGREFAMTFE